MDNINIGIQNKEITEAGTLIISMNPVNNAKWISTAELIAAEVAVVSYGVISVPEYETIEADDLIIYVNIDNIIWQTSLATLIAGAIGEEIEFSIGSSGGGGGGQNDAEITKWIEGETFSIIDSNASIIGSNTFSALKIVNLSVISATSIGERAFDNCKNLNSVYAPATEFIASSAFRGCTNIETVFFENLKDVKVSAFANCTGLTEATLKGNISFIGGSVFVGCTNLSKLTIDSASLTGSSICSGLKSLNTVILNVGSINIGAFNGCNALESVYLTRVSTVITSVHSTTAFTNTPLIDSSYLGKFGSIYVPSEMYSLYIANNSWASFTERFVSY